MICVFFKTALAQKSATDLEICVFFKTTLAQKLYFFTNFHVSIMNLADNWVGLLSHFHEIKSGLIISTRVIYSLYDKQNIVQSMLS